MLAPTFAKTIMGALAFAALASPALAGSSPVALDKLPFEEVHDGASRAIIATDPAGRPLSVLLKINKGAVLPPHGEAGGLRLLTVLSGDLTWGDSDTLGQGEKLYRAGSVVVLPAVGGTHWAAAKTGDVLIQVVFVRDGALMKEAAPPAP